MALERHRRWVRRRGGRLRGSLLKVWKRWRNQTGAPPPPEVLRRGWNRTPRHLEERLVHLHVERPDLGAGQLAHLSERLLGLATTRETVRRILLRQQALITELEDARQKRRHRIRVKRRLELWGADITLLWVLGIFPVWVLGLIDYQGSQLVALERLRWPTSAEAARVLSKAVARHGVPSRVLTDNGGAFIGPEWTAFLAANNIRHTRIRPGHAWTNGRIERLFRTMKETFRAAIWLFADTAQVDRFCADFLVFYNRDRPHSAWKGMTPDEAAYGRKKRRGHRGRVEYFDGHLHWWRFG